MKNKIVIIFFSCLFISAQERESQLPEKEIYLCRNVNGYNDYIEVHHISDTFQRCIYMGVELRPNLTPVYYKSEFIHKKPWNSERIFRFNISNFTFCKNPCNSKGLNFPVKPSMVPFVLQSPMSFWGEFHGDTLRIIRTTALPIFSNADEFVFHKIKKYPTE